MTAALAVLAGLLGLAVGSFLNVVIWRVPRGESVVHAALALPRLRCTASGRAMRSPSCPGCLLERRCRDCRRAISARYPLVELLTGGSSSPSRFAFADARRPGCPPISTWPPSASRSR